MNTLLDDLRYAARTLRRTPGFTAIVILTLAITIGATTAMFSVVNGVLLHPFPYNDPDRLVNIYERNERGGIGAPSYPNFLDWRAQSTVFQRLAFARGDGVRVRGPEGIEQITGAWVTPGFLPLLGVEPLLGRGFSADEEREGGDAVLLLSYGLWQRRYGGDRSVIGTPVTLSDKRYTIIGVMPRGVESRDWEQFWTPIANASSDRALTQRGVRSDNFATGRLMPGVSIQRARAEMNVIARRLAAAHPAENRDWGVQVESLTDSAVGFARPALLVLLSAVALVLLIACANVANLSLVRASGRSTELAVRAALGADRGRVARQLLTESVVLALAGGSLGLLAGAALLRVLKAAAPGDIPRIDLVTIDWRVVCFVAGTSVLTALLVGLAPALRAATPDLMDALKSGARGTGGARQSRLRGAFLVGEIALSLMLLVGAGLLVQSFLRLREVSPGFNPERLIVLRVLPSGPAYRDDPRRLALFTNVAEALRRLPGVRSVALVNHAPMGRAGVMGRFVVGDHPAAPGQEEFAAFLTAGAGYFETMEIPLRAGRTFTQADMTAPIGPVIVSESLARINWPSENPIGRRLTIFKAAPGKSDTGEAIDAMVVGVAGDVKRQDLSTPATAAIYLPLTANLWGNAHVVIRTSADAAALIPTVRRTAAAAAGEVHIEGPDTMREWMAGTLAERRFNMQLLAAFAVTALALAALGIYGVLSYTVTQRTREIGIRMALGAERTSVLGLVVWQGLKLAIIGTVIGLAGALALTRVLSGQLYGVSATDPLTMLAVAALLAAVALVASYIPGRRAARVDPLVAIRTAD